MKKIEKKSFFISGLLLCGLLISGLPAYFISLYGSPISREAVFYLLWGLFSIPYGTVAILYLVIWYKEK